jgi:hypothetical protein
MDVPLAINDIGIQKGLKGNRKSSTFSHKADVVGLSALIKIFTFEWLQIKKLYHKC